MRADARQARAHANRAGRAKRHEMPSRRIGDAYFAGASGVTYKFAVFEPEADIPPVGGVFVVSGVARDRRRSDERRVWLIGRSDDLARTAGQLARHTRLEGVGRRHICIRVEDRNRRARTRIAKDLAEAHRPPIRPGD